MGKLVNNYVFKALENYPYDLDEVMEALHYALSYDSKNTMALTLMGKVYAEKLYKYDEAIVYFKEALGENINAFEVYEPYIRVLLWNEDYKEAEKFIEFALTVKGSDKAVLYVKKAVLYEQINKYKEALGFLKTAKKYTYNSDYITTINTEKERIKGKIPKIKKEKKDTEPNSVQKKKKKKN